MKKVNQHFVPKFYLRYFSYLNNKKQIGVYNLNSKRIISNAPLKSQAYKANFYGADGELEEALSEIEDKTAILWNKMVNAHYLPVNHSKEYDLLLLFIVVLKHRNPYAAKEMNDLIDSQIRAILKIANPKEFDEKIHYAHKTPVDLSLSNVLESIAYIQDLGFKILVNSTRTPFITSDNPAVFYNSFLEMRNYTLGSTGYASLGLQIFLPLNPQTVLFLYDSSVYKVGNLNESIVPINFEEDVNQLNVLQLMNCIRNVYFNHQLNTEYLSVYSNKCRKPSTNRGISLKQIDRVIKDGKLQKNSMFLHTQATGIKIGLRLTFMEIITKAKRMKIEMGRVQLRKRYKQ